MAVLKRLLWMRGKNSKVFAENYNRTQNDNHYAENNLSIKLEMRTVQNAGYRRSTGITSIGAKEELELTFL
jgi:hypothetical protein